MISLRSSAVHSAEAFCLGSGSACRYAKAFPPAWRRHETQAQRLEAMNPAASCWSSFSLWLAKHRRKVCSYAQGDQYHLPCRPLSKLRHQENGRDNKREQ